MLLLDLISIINISMGYGSIYFIDISVIRGSRQKTIVGTRILRISSITFALGFHSGENQRQPGFSSKFLNHKTFPRLSRADTGAQLHDPNLFWGSLGGSIN